MIAVHRDAAMRQRRATARKTQPVTTTSIADPRVWRAAMRIAGGDVRLLDVLGYRRVRVRDSRYDPPR